MLTFTFACYCPLVSLNLSSRYFFKTHSALQIIYSCFSRTIVSVLGSSMYNGYNHVIFVKLGFLVMINH